MASKPPALGKGLGALISSRSSSASAQQAAVVPSAIAQPQPGERVLSLKIGQVVASPLQPRTEFHAEQLTELVASIRERGIIQPLIVRVVRGSYELIAGERRWRAAKEVGLAEVPAIVREATDREVLELALVENLQREDLNPIEEALAYARLSREFSMTQEEIARRVGKNRATVANAMRLLDLDEDIQAHVRQGRLSVGHAKALLSLKDPAMRTHAAERIIREAAPVRAAEKLIAALVQSNGNSGGKGKKSPAQSLNSREPSIQRLENLLQHRLGTRVVIHHKDKTGTIHIEYYGLDDLDRLLAQLGVASNE